RADWYSLEGEYGVSGEALSERLPVAGAHALVVPRDVLVQQVDPGREPEILAEVPEHHAVLPLTVSAVRTPLRSLLDEADALGVADRAVVEAVDLELQAVEPEIEQEVTLEDARRLLGEPLSAEARVERETA